MQGKTMPRLVRGIEMKRVAGNRNARKPPIVIPIIVIAVAVHIAHIVPPIEGEVTERAYERPSVTPPFEYSGG